MSWAEISDVQLRIFFFFSSVASDRTDGVCERLLLRRCVTVTTFAGLAQKRWPTSRASVR